jgi:anti-sigma factor RsiW
MTTTSETVSERDLHAWVDGLLEPERRELVLDFLARHPDETLRLEAYRNIDQAVHGRYDRIVEEPVPERLVRAALRSRRARVLALAAAVGWMAVGGALVWLLGGRTPGDTGASAVTSRLVRPAVVAHAVYVPEVRHPVEVPGDQQKHLAGWLTKRLGTEVTVPDLTTAGFALVGGRLLPGEGGGTAAQFMYEDDSGLRLTLYVRTDRWANEETAFRYAGQDGISTFYWIDGAAGYALVGAVGRERLLEIAHLVYRSRLE